MLPSTKLCCRLKLFYLRVSIRLAMTSKDLNAQNLISQEELTCCAAFPLSSSDGFPVVSAYCREDDGPASEALTLPFFWIHFDAPNPLQHFMYLLQYLVFMYLLQYSIFIYLLPYSTFIYLLPYSTFIYLLQYSTFIYLLQYLTFIYLLPYSIFIFFFRKII